MMSSPGLLLVATSSETQTTFTLSWERLLGDETVKVHRRHIRSWKVHEKIHGTSILLGKYI